MSLKYILPDNFGKLLLLNIFLKLGAILHFFPKLAPQSLNLMELSIYLHKLLSCYKDKRVKKHFTPLYSSGFVAAFEII